MKTILAILLLLSNALLARAAEPTENLAKTINQLLADAEKS